MLTGIRISSSWISSRSLVGIRACQLYWGENCKNCECGLHTTSASHRALFSYRDKHRSQDVASCSNFVFHSMSEDKPFA